MNDIDAWGREIPISGTPYCGIVGEKECERFKKDKCKDCPEKDKDFCYGVKESMKASRRKKNIRRMPFGKHKGTPICECPTDYLEWLKRQDGYKYLDAGFKIALSKTINLRHKYENILD